MKFKDQVVLITGSTRGIGRSLAESFAKDGAVAIIIGRNENLAREVKDSIVKKGFKADYFLCDVSNTVNVQETVNKILDKHSRIDILVNNAGVTKDNLLLRLSENDWDEVINVNLKGVYNFTKTVAKAMLKAKKGKIISITSIIGITGNVGQANYAASKAGIIGFSKSVAKELASRGITVNCVAPGFIQTEMTDQMTDKAKEQIINSIPLGRLGQSDDVVGACKFLASKAADYITGQTIVVDGGLAI